MEEQNCIIAQNAPHTVISAPGYSGARNTGSERGSVSLNCEKLSAKEPERGGDIVEQAVGVFGGVEVGETEGDGGL